MLPPNRLCLKIQLCVFRADITSSYICNTVCCCILSRLCMTRDKRNVAFVCVCVRDYSSEATKQASRCTIHTTHIADIFLLASLNLCVYRFSPIFFLFPSHICFFIWIYCSHSKIMAWLGPVTPKLQRCFSMKAKICTENTNKMMRFFLFFCCHVHCSNVHCVSPTHTHHE